APLLHVVLDARTDVVVAGNVGLFVAFRRDRIEIRHLDRARVVVHALMSIGDRQIIGPLDGDRTRILVILGVTFGDRYGLFAGHRQRTIGTHGDRIVLGDGRRAMALDGVGLIVFDQRRHVFL